MKRAIALIAVCLMMTHQAFAIFDAQLLVGQSTIEVGSDEYSGTRTDMAFHLDPIPLVPVGFGLNLSNQSVEKDGLKLDGVIISPEIFKGEFQRRAKQITFEQIAVRNGEGRDEKTPFSQIGADVIMSIETPIFPGNI